MNYVITYKGDGVTTHYAFPFDYRDERFVKVYLNSDIQTGTYTITGKYVTFNTAPVANTVITILRDTNMNIIEFTPYTINDARTLNEFINMTMDVAEEIKDVKGISGDTIAEINRLIEEFTQAVNDGKIEIAQAKYEAIIAVQQATDKAEAIETHVQQMYDEFVAKVDEVLDGGAPDSIYTEPDIDGGEINA